MAEFKRNASDARTPEQHSNDIFRNTLNRDPLKPFMGRRGEGTMIVVDPSLTVKAGETTHFHFVPQADVDPIRGQDTSIKGNESKFSEFTTSVTVDEVNFAFKTTGDMTEQRTLINARMETMKQVENSFVLYNPKQLFKVMSGFGISDSDSLVASSTGTITRVNGQNRAIRADGTTDWALVTEGDSDNLAVFTNVTAADKLNPTLISRAAVMAATSTPYKLEPLRMKDGDEVYVLFVSRKAGFDLRQNPDWIAHALAVPDRDWENDQIARGALGTIDNVIVKEVDWVKEVTDGSRSVARNLLVGANAVGLAFGKNGTLRLVEDTEDYDREYGVRGVEIRGEVKLAFTDQTVSPDSNDTSNDIDYGIAQVLTASD
jgi:N4-gp56 family major capsid protein